MGLRIQSCLCADTCDMGLVTLLHVLRPNKAFIASWISTGYFTAEHFPESDMTREDAMRVLDPTGMLVTMGIRSEQAAQPPLDPKRL